MRSASPDDGVIADRVLQAMEEDRRPDRESMGWLAELAADGVLAARVLLALF
jgi:hypothetical protein